MNLQPKKKEGSRRGRGIRRGEEEEEEKKLQREKEWRKICQGKLKDEQHTT